MNSQLIASLLKRAFHFACIALALTTTMASLTATAVECLPVDGSSAAASIGSASELQPTVEELLRLYNVSRQEIETSRQQHLATHHSSQQPHQQFATGHSTNQVGTTGRQHPHVHSEVLSSAQLVPASVVQKALRNR